MKKILYLFLLPILAMVISATVTSCGDNTDFSKAHVYTQEELDYIAYKDSLDSVNRSRINADLILEYTVQDYPTSSNWTSKNLNIDIDKIAELFGLTEQQVIDGINQEDGAPSITGFAIQNTTHADYNKRSTSNGAWGHWFDVNGDAGTWSDLNSLGTIGFYVEWQDEYFAIGQFPGKFSAGTTFKAIEGLQYENKRVAVVVNFEIVERGSINASVVYNKTIECKQYQRTSYDADAIEFDLDAVKAALGVSSLSEAEVLGVNADGSYTQDYTGDGVGGFWYHEDGFPGTYDGGYFYINYYGYDADYPEDEYTFYLGQMPSAIPAGYTASPKIGFIANNKIAMFTINFSVIAYQDPETAPEGTPTTDTTINVTIEKSWTDTYNNVTYDVKDVLRNAFKMTTYQIHTAKISGALKVYCKTKTDADPSYTSDTPGYWLDLNGDVTTWGNNSAVFACLGSSETDLWLYAGNFPDQTSCPTNTEVNTVYLICCNGGMVTVNLTVKVGGV
jgi:sulfur carrier protein ThiS